MRPVLVIALKDLRQRLRDRSVLLLAVVAPIVITVVMNLAFGGGGSTRFALTLADADHGPLAQVLVEALHSRDLSGLVSVRTASTPPAAQRLVDGGDADAGLVVPAGFSDAVQQGRAARVTVLSRSDRPIAAGVAQALAGSFAARLNAVALAAQTAVGAGQPASSLPELVAAAGHLAPPVTAVQSAGGTPLKSSSYFAAGMGTFFLFFTVTFVGRGMVDERHQGTLVRLLAAPVRPHQILLGKVLSTFVIGCGAMGIMWAVSALAFSSPWGPPAAVIPLIVAVVLAAMGITALVLTLARTDEAAERWATIITMVLAIVGGNFFNLYALPAPLAAVSQATPNGQFLRAVTDLVTGGGGLVSVLPAIGVIAAFAALAGGVAAVRSGRMVRL